MSYLVKQGRAGKTIGHYLKPVRFTALWMSQSHPDRYSNFCAGLRIPKDTRQSYLFEDQQPAGYLTIAEVCDFLEWTRANYPQSCVIRPGVALQALCGLQLQEALRLTTDKVDLDSGTITIEGQVKNRWRVRRLPVPRRTLEVLRDAIESASTSDNRIVRHGGTHPWKAYSSLVAGSLDK